MPQSTKPTIREIQVRNGKVDCPLRGVIDVELCFYCANLVTVDLDSRHPSVVCQAATDVSDKQRKAYKWMSILQLAERYGNVSKICRENGISRSMFYRYKRRYERFGFNGLLNPPQRLS